VKNLAAGRAVFATEVKSGATMQVESKGVAASSVAVAIKTGMRDESDVDRTGWGKKSH
jgi:hypothetical protein